MLFKSREHTGIKNIQGAFISSEDIKKVLNNIPFNYDCTKKFEIQQSDLDALEPEPPKNGSTSGLVRYTPENDDELLSKIIMYALGLNSISCNVIEDIFRLGYRRASGFLEKLYQINVIGDKYAKLPRPVIPIHFEDLSVEIVNFLNLYGYSEEAIKRVLSAKH
jgi:DNA segregation ATPase FtsK/SpoIIIE-like protein